TINWCDLVSALKSELGGLFESLIVALMTPTVSYDASQLHKALKCKQSSPLLFFPPEFGGKLEKDICSDTSGHYQRLLVILLQVEMAAAGKTYVSSHVYLPLQDLYAAGEDKFGTDEETFITILGNRSAEHLRRVFDAYRKLSGSDIEDSIKGETTGNLENLMLAVVKCVKSIPEFFAERLYKSMRRAGTDDDTLMRIMVSRSEVDMLDIRASFKKMYGVSLYTTIQVHLTYGEYQKVVVSLSLKKTVKFKPVGYVN
uniref:Annexin A5a n=1 Tax=Mastacembelus armatus TaxID=205130 RepID=A0A7N8Y6D9_9TELE